MKMSEGNVKWIKDKEKKWRKARTKKKTKEIKGMNERVH